MLSNWIIIGVKPASFDNNFPPENKEQRSIPTKSKLKKKKDSKLKKNQTNCCGSNSTETEPDLSLNGNRDHLNEIFPQIPDSLPASFQNFLECSYRMIAEVEEAKGDSQRNTNRQQENLNWNSNAPVQLKYESSSSSKSKEPPPVKYRTWIQDRHWHQLLGFFRLRWDSLRLV